MCVHTTHAHIIIRNLFVISVFFISVEVIAIREKSRVLIYIFLTSTLLHDLQVSLTPLHGHIRVIYNLWQRRWENFTTCSARALNLLPITWLRAWKESRVPPRKRICIPTHVKEPPAFFFTSYSRRLRNWTGMRRKENLLSFSFFLVPDKFSYRGWLPSIAALEVEGATWMSGLAILRYSKIFHSHLESLVENAETIMGKG